MTVYFIRRLAQVIPLLLMVIVINFAIIRMAPGDPAVLMAGETAPTEYVEALRERMGLNGPMHVQLGRYLRTVLQGDLGQSFRAKRPVADVILQAVPNSLILMIPAKLLAVLFGIALGVLAASRLNTWTDYGISSSSVIFYAVPHFWLGILLVLLFGVWLGWLPIGGARTIGVPLAGLDMVIDRLRYAVLPVMTLALADMAVYARFTRASVLQVLQQDYVRTARSKGCAEGTVLFKHAAKNALLPVVTLVALRIPNLLTGSVLVETVFAWPGMGRLMYTSIYQRDYPVLMGIFIMVSILLVVANLLADLLYAWLDPRIRFQ